MRRVRLTLALVLSSASALAQPGPEAAALEATFESVSKRLASFRTVRGSFVQTREIAGLTRPLHSRGRFIVSELGLFWEQSEPFESRLVAREESLFQQVEGRTTLTITAADRPVAVSISRVFLGIFKGDRGRLAEHFEVEFDAENEDWRIRLEPISFPLTESVERIVVEGSRYLERLIVEGIAEDVLTIELTEQRTEPAELTETERALYAP